MKIVCYLTMAFIIPSGGMKGKMIQETFLSCQWFIPQNDHTKKRFNSRRYDERMKSKEKVTAFYKTLIN